MDPWGLGMRVMLLLQKVSFTNERPCSVCYTLYLLCFALLELCLRRKIITSCMVLRIILGLNHCGQAGIRYMLLNDFISGELICIFLT